MGSPKDHKERAHALLSASGSDRWMNCTPSARMEDKFSEETSSFAAEGTLAHEFGELFLLRDSGTILPSEYSKRLKDLRAHELYTDEMEEQVMKYVDYVMEQYQVAKKITPDAILSIEDKIDLTEYIEDGFGSNDAAIIADSTLYVSDLKYGTGIRVQADNNSQLMLYGLGALLKASLMYDIDTVSLNIIQPRLDHVSAWKISAEDLFNWGEEQVKPRAELAYAGEGELCAGDWCKWCKAKAPCRALHDKNLELAKHDFKDPKLLSDKELMAVYKQLHLLTDWAKAVKSYLLKEAIGGKKWEGHKVVAGKSNRKWVDEEKIKEILREEMFEDEKFLNTKLKGLGDIEKLVGKADFDELLGEHIEKPEGKPTLVPDSDKRKPFGLGEAQEDFK